MLVQVAEVATFIVLLWVAYAFVTQDGRPDQWWSFLPFKTGYITGYHEWLRRLREW